MRAVGYVRVSTEEQGELGASLEAQRRSIADRVSQRGWELMGVCEDVASG
jgi:DNA invertase Pin-like site-specific DNA recombinase